MTKFPAFLFYPEDFAAGTAHMSPLAVGVYIRCLCHQWSHGSIPSDQRQIARLCGAMPDELAEAWPMVVGKFIETEPGELKNARLESVRDDLLRTSKKRSRAGKRGAKAKWGDGRANGKGMAKAKQTDNKTMASRVEDVNEDTNAFDFEAFWNAFPAGRKSAKGRARKAWNSAILKHPPAEIIAAALEYAASEVGRGQFVKGPETWLNGECWADDRRAWRDKGRDGDPRGTKSALQQYLGESDA